MTDERRRATGRRPTIGALAASLVLAGCVTTMPGMSTAVDPNDVCGQARADLESSKDFFTQSVIAGAVGGALLGGLGGALFSGLRGGDDMGESIAVGAATGAVVGGVGAYFQARQKHAADQRELARTVYEDVTKDGAEIDRATLTFIKLKECRFAAAERIKADFKAGRIERATAAARLAEQQRRFDEEIALAEQLGAKMTERQQEYQFAAQQLLAEDPEAMQRYAARQAAPATSSGVGLYTAVANANVRAGPSRQAQRIGLLAKGSKVMVTGEAGAEGWRQILLADGRLGYVWEELLAPESATGSFEGAVPTASAGATATMPATRSAASAFATSDGRTEDAATIAAATESNLDKRGAYQAAVDAAATQKTVVFDLDKSLEDTLSRLSVQCLPRQGASCAA